MSEFKPRTGEKNSPSIIDSPVGFEPTALRYDHKRSFASLLSQLLLLLCGIAWFSYVPSKIFQMFMISM